MSEETKELITKETATSALITASASLFFDVAKFEHAQRVAKVLMASTIVPEHFRDNIGNCIIALNYAERIQADPFMVMQNMYVVYGRPGIEGKLVIALINQSNKYSEPLKFEFAGTGDEYGCTAYTREAKSGEVVRGPKITLKIVKAEGWDKDKGTMKSKWNTMPDVMYRYRAASWFANTNCPELKLGMSTVEEIHDFVDLQRDESGKYGITDVIADKIDEKQLSTLRDMLADKEAGEGKFCTWLKIETLETLPASRYAEAFEAIKAKKKTPKKPEKEADKKSEPEDVKGLIEQKNKELGVE
jgi:hypothetical protein